jgi:hypothetical protein
MRAALAWHLGGRTALEVLDGPIWQPPADVVEEGRTAVASAFGRASVRGERVTHHEAGLQLRYGRDELWYLLEKRSGTWEMHQPPAVEQRIGEPTHGRQCLVERACDEEQRAIRLSPVSSFPHRTSGNVELSPAHRCHEQEERRLL